MAAGPPQPKPARSEPGHRALLGEMEYLLIDDRTQPGCGTTQNKEKPPSVRVKTGVCDAGSLIGLGPPPSISAPLSKLGLRGVAGGKLFV